MSPTETQVAIIGGGITGLACAQRLKSLGIDCLLLEAGSRVGGKIRTIQEDGYQFEAGPNTLIANKQAMLDVIHEAGLGNEVVDGAPESRRRWITLNGKLWELPSSPIAALRSPLLGTSAVLRALSDLFARKLSAPPGPESVADFITRHFGERVLNNLVVPFLKGIYAGDVHRLEARSVLPTLIAAESRSGSIIRGMIANSKSATKSGAKRLPMRTITFKQGLESLPGAIANSLGPIVRTDCPVLTLHEDNDHCRVDLGGTSAGEEILADRVIITTGGRPAADFIDQVGGSQLAVSLRRIPHASLAMVGLAFPRDAVPHPLDGFGYLNGPGATGPVLGCLFRSSVFPQVAPSGQILLVTFIGGANHPESARLSDDALISLARKELGEGLNCQTAPTRIFLHRWPNAIPQYEKGHADIRAAADRFGTEHRVSITGSLIAGLSLNDCAAAGRAEADRLASLLKAKPQEKPLCTSV
jgi:oxygen-dependent protoporphyrinogen oxidase